MGTQTSSVSDQAFRIESEIIAEQQPSNSTQENEEDDQYFDEQYFGQDSLFEVPEEDMNQALHKSIVAIVGRVSNETSRGTGLLISSNLVLTCAHNFFQCTKNGGSVTKNKIKDQSFELYPGQHGKMQRPYRIQKVFIPDEYRGSNHQKSLLYDYALIKLSEKVETNDFLTLLADATYDDQMQIGIFGYPASSYKQCGKTQTMFSVIQKGLVRKKCITQIKHQKGRIKHIMSTQSGQSGSPIILIKGQDLISKQSMRVIGIHKGGTAKQTNNVGRLLTKQLLHILIAKAEQLGAERFSYEINRESLNLNLGQKDLNKRGNELYSKKQYQAALKYYNKSLQLNPQNPIIFNNIGILFQQTNKMQLAIKSFQSALRLNPKQTCSLNNLGAAFQSIGKIKEAESCFRRSFDINPYDITAYNSLGLLLASQSRFEQAISCYEASLKIDQKSQKTYFYLGYAKSKLGKFEDAIKNYQKSAQLSPSYLSCHYYLGLIYCNKTYQYDKARRAFERCIDIEPKYQPASRLLRRLRNRKQK